MEFSRQEYCSGLPFPSPGDLPDAGTEPRSPSLQADSLPLYHLLDIPFKSTFTRGNQIPCRFIGLVNKLALGLFFYLVHFSVGFSSVFFFPQIFLLDPRIFLLRFSIPIQSQSEKNFLYTIAFDWQRALANVSTFQFQGLQLQLGLFFWGALVGWFPELMVWHV